MACTISGRVSLLILFVSLHRLCEGDYSPFYGTGFTVFFNDSSGSIPSRRFPDQEVVSFSDYDYFSKEIDIGNIISNSVVVGGKNVLYQLDLDLTMQSSLSWDITPTIEQTCVNAGNPRFVCQNHIRSVHKIPSSTSHVLVCGTQADQNPQCVAVDISSNVLGMASAPTTVPDGIVSYFVDSPGFGEFIDAAGTGTGNMDNRFFSASYGSNTRDFLMSYQNVNYNPANDPPLTVAQSFRTRATDNFWLRSPVTFVDLARVDYPSVASSEFYFIFLRENFELRQRGFSIETITSRVVRLCRNDPGSSADNYFASFIKSEIFCELEAPSNNRSVNTIDFTYREITSMAFNAQAGGRYAETADSRRALYGAFVGANIGPSGSAVCIYGADTSGQDTVYSVFTEDLLNYTPPLTDNPLPQEQNIESTCATTRTDERARYYVESTVRIAQIGANPILVLGQHKITQMVVDSQCVVQSGSPMSCVDQDILLMGTDRGTILKVSFATTAQRQIDPVISEEISFDDSNGIKDMKLQTINSSKVLFASTDSKLYRVPLAKCGRHDECSVCIGARDPYCVWNTDTQLCEVNTLDSTETVASNFRQNIHTISTYPTVFFPELNYSLVESPSVLTVTLNISSPQSEPVIVEVTSRDGSATAGVDYVAVNMNVTIAAQQTLVTFQVTIIDDQSLEAGDESFTLNLRGMGTVCVRTGDAATVTIQDNDSAVVSITSSSLMVAEGVGSVELQVSRGVPSSEEDISFYVATADVTATAPSDFSGISRTLFTIPSGSSSVVNITIPIVNDRILEANETFLVVLEMADNPSLGSRVTIGNSKTTVTILDDDNIWVGFDSSQYDVSEQDSTVLVTLRILKVGSNQVPVTISTSLESGTASNGTDFLFYPNDVEFSQSDAVQEIQVNILPDVVVESVENFTIALQSSSLSVLTLSGQDRATIVIQDNDVIVRFVMASRNVTVREDGGSVLLTVEASGSLEEPVSVSVATTNGQATAPSDYTFTTPTSIQLTSVNPVRTISVPIMDDSIFEGDIESFTVELSGGGGSVQLQNNVATINIVDDDVVMAEFVEASRAVIVDEDIGTVMLMVRSLGGVMDETVTLGYTTTPGTATGNSDYTSTTGTIQLSGGGMATISVSIVNDNIYESSLEDFTVTLSTQSSRVELRVPQATVSIRDNDDLALVLQFPSTPTENDSFVELLITKSIANEVPVEFVVSTADITATSYSDYAPLVSLATSFTPSMSSSNMSFRIAIVDDQVVEGPETFNVSLTSPSPRVTAMPAQNTVTIIDNDVFIIGFDSSSYTADEATILPVKVVRQGGYGSVTVTISSAGITANPGVDFSLPAATVSFSNDEIEKILYVNILNDTVYEGPESFQLTLLPGSQNVQLVQNQAVITIDDITVVSVAFNQSEYLIGENGGSVVLTVDRAPVTLAISFVLQFHAISQTAINPEDYTTTNTPLTFPASSSTSVQYTIAIVNDAVYESDETFLVVMSSDDSGVSVSAMSSTTVIIADDDMLQFRFTSTLYTANRGSVIPVVILKQGSYGLSVTVNISVTSEAASSKDISFQPQVVTFSPNQNEQQVNLVIQSNTGSQGSETFILTMIPNDLRVVIENSANVTIEDVSVLSIGFVRNEYTVDENEGSVDLIVSRNTSSPILVQLQFISQSATAVQDYGITSLSYTLSNPSLTDTIPIQVEDDSILEKSSETFAVVLTTEAPGVIVQGMSTAMVTIVDNDNNSFNFKDNDLKVQYGRTLSVVVIRTQGTATIPVVLLVSAQVDSGGSSNSPWNSTVLFEPQQNSASVIVPTDDVLDGKPGTFSLSLSLGAASEDIRNRISIGTAGSSNALATVEVEPTDVIVVTGGQRTCPALTGSSTFLAVLIVLLAVIAVLVVIVVLLCIFFRVQRERKKTHPRKRTVSPYSRETSTTVLNNMNASEDSPDGSPGSNRSEDKADLSRRQDETNIDDPFESNKNHVIHTTTSGQSSKEPSEQHDRSAFQYSPSPTSLDISTKTQSNGNELTLM